MMGWVSFHAHFFFTTPTSRSVWTGAWSLRLWHDFEHVLCWLKLPLFHTIQRVLAKQKWSALYEATIFSIQIFIMLDTGFWEEFWTPRFLEFVRRPQFLGWEVIRESTHIFSIVQTCGPSFHRLDNLPLSLRQNSDQCPLLHEFYFWNKWKFEKILFQSDCKIFACNCNL